ncbi:hypothetical protein AMS68_002524 [Peltaster fructicola]|uniref:Transmembrane 9 superfamily member n=1 Tax=Peltaster fructicola TaxID=286661 RepID=A0A6H0XQH3_9PEZI|nr:hypothetical protein AMS68_002524 [Peltaster fructicola]
MAHDFRVTCAALVLLCLRLTSAFYIPGWSIRSWSDGEAVPLFVNKAYSDHSEIQYAYAELPFVCDFKGRQHGLGFISGNHVALNIGEVLNGDRIIVSDYDIEMGKDDEAHYLCSKEIDRAGLQKPSRSLLDCDGQAYILPQQPCHACASLQQKGAKKVIVGFEIYTKSIEAGNRDEFGLPADLHNVHRGLELSMAHNSTNLSMTHEFSNSIGEDDGNADAKLTIPYTYSVYFREDDKIGWANRWDLYFVNQEESTKIHWLSIVNSLVIAAILSAIVVVILARTISRDIKGVKDGALEDGTRKIRRKGPRSPRKSTEKGGLLDQPDVDPNSAIEDDLASEEELEDLTGWKLVHGDVFRAPAFGTVLAPLVGSGTQLLLMALGLIALACFGVLNPSFRGGFISVGLALFILAGVISGYFSARIYKTFGGTVWKQNALLTASLFPGLLFATVFILNLFVWAQASSTAIPVGTLVAVVALWLLIQLPLVYFGSWYGFVRAGAYIHPIKATTVPRQIPRTAWSRRGLQAIFLTGIVPFAVIWIELLFVFRSMWQDKSGYYYVFGFMTVVSAILILAVMETTVIAVYTQLCAEDYHWWWSSFCFGASSSIWIFGYCVYYFCVHLHITSIASTVLFFAYAFMACTVYGLLMGTVGFLTAYAFVRRIYGAVKID